MSYWLGRREEKRLGLEKGASIDLVAQRTLSDAELKLRRPQNFWINIVLTIVVLGTMVALGDKLTPAIVFMIGTCLALLINYPNVDTQRQRVDAHAKAALLMASILIAAGVFTGIMQGSGMLKAIRDLGVRAFTMRDIDEMGMRNVIQEAIKIATNGTASRRATGAAITVGMPQ